MSKLGSRVIVGLPKACVAALVSVAMWRCVYSIKLKARHREVPVSTPEDIVTFFVGRAGIV